MINESGLEFTDISSEEWRNYRFSNLEHVHILNPVALHASERGHRILDGQGVSHYIPNGWIHLTWKAKEGKPNFVK